MLKDLHIQLYNCCILYIRTLLTWLYTEMTIKLLYCLTSRWINKYLSLVKNVIYSIICVCAIPEVECMYRINSILFFICLKLIGYTNKRWISALKKYGSILFPILWSILNKLIAISKIIFVSKILFSFSYSKTGSMG